jgi:hypothetical protein
MGMGHDGVNARRAAAEGDGRLKRGEGANSRQRTRPRRTDAFSPVESACGSSSWRELIAGWCDLQLRALQGAKVGL